MFKDLECGKICLERKQIRAPGLSEKLFNKNKSLDFVFIHSHHRGINCVTFCKIMNHYKLSEMSVL